MATVQIIVNGRQMAAALCNLCGAKVAPVAALKAHKAAHGLLPGGCVECRKPLAGDGPRCKSCEQRQARRQRGAVFGRRGAGIARRRRGVAEFGESVGK